MGIELLAPAGNLKTALYALGAGADAVYCGLKEFSARAGAENFGMTELRRLKAYARQHEKRVYVTLNTIITQAELPRMRSLLFELLLMETDAVIIQDFGLLELLREEFPTLMVHISTQMAVHNLAGAQLLFNLGAKRIVLARELSLAEIGQIRNSLPELPLEVFCHGALCHSFSGLCLASGLMLGRSANRGRCAQVCRTWFTRTCDNESGYYFSMNDLALYEKVGDLARLGVAAIKIEGRMKDPSYVIRAVKLYRAILDHETQRNFPATVESHAPMEVPDIEKLKAAARLTFSRTPTPGYAADPRGERLVEVRYPSHMGLYAGKVKKVDPPHLALEAAVALQLHDRLMFLPQSSTLRPGHGDEAGGRIVLILNAHLQRCRSAAAGDAIRIEITGKLPSGAGPWDVFLVKRDEPGKPALAALDEKMFPMFTIPLPLRIVIDDKGVTLTIPPLAFAGEECIRYDGAVTKATGDGKALHTHLEALFAQSGSSLYRVAQLAIDNRSSHENPFFPPSFWKMAKKSFYACLEKSVAAALEAVAQGSLPIPPPMPCLELDDPLRAKAAHRSRLNPAGQAHGRRIPYLLPSTPCTLIGLGELGPWHVIPLMPVLFDHEPYFNRIAALFAANPGQQFLVGLNNCGHLAPCAKQLAQYANCSFFLDVHLYIASGAALAFFTKRLPRVVFFYQWVEEDGEPLAGGIRLADKSCLPYFISRSCHQRHIISPDGRCPPGCKGQYSTSFTNGGRRFDLLTEDCLSFLFERS